jgi:diguanylate cyclase (GGDEF)-like protein
MNSLFDHLTSYFESIEGEDIPKDEVEQLATFIQRAILAYDSARFKHNYQHWANDILSLIETIELIAKPSNIDYIAADTAKHFATSLDADGCALCCWDPESGLRIAWGVYGRFKEEFFSLCDQDFSQPIKNTSIQRILDGSRLVKYRIDDAEITDAERHLMETAGVKSRLLLPIIVEDTITGVIEILDSKSSHIYDEHQLSISQLLANKAGQTIHRLRNYNAADQRANELEAIYQASLSLTASLDLGQVLDAILESTLSLMKNAQDAHIFLYDEDVLKFGSALWADGTRGKVWAELRPEGLTYSVARGGHPILVNDMRNHPLFMSTPSDWGGSIVGLPLKIGGRVVGVMTVAHSKKFGFSEDSLRVLRLLGDQAAIAIENARLHNLVNQQAHTDMLTGLPNRRALIERLEAEIRRSIRYKRHFSLMMIDLDDFKEINDLFGHPVGDSVLQDIAQRMLETIRDTDFLTRYGGDEFALLLPETEQNTAEDIAHRLQREIQNFKLSLPEHSQKRLGLSTGLATFPIHGTTINMLIKTADQNLYHKKKDRSDRTK